MAARNPIFAGLQSNLLRLLELTKSGLVQIGTLGIGATDSNYAPMIDFDDDRIIVGSNSTSHRMVVLEYNGNAVSDSGTMIGSDAVFAFNPRDRVVLRGDGNSTSKLDTFKIENNFSDSISDNAPAESLGLVLDMACTRDGEILLRARINGIDQRYRVGVDENGFPLYSDAHTQINLGSGDSNFERIFTSNDGHWAIAYRSGGRAILLARDGNTFSFAAEIATTDASLGDVETVTMSLDTRYVAVGYKNGTTYTTRLLRRVGPYLSEVCQLANMGVKLVMLADSSIIMDPTKGTAYSVDDGSAVDIGASNFTGSYFAAAFSHDAIGMTGLGYLYDGTVGATINRDFEFDKLRLMLLDENATFTPTHSTLSEVTESGAREVYGSGWPQGGIELENVRVVETTGGASITADDASKLIFGSSLNCRYGLIYHDEGNKQPLVMIDFGGTLNLAPEKLATFSFLETGFLAFSA